MTNTASPFLFDPKKVQEMFQMPTPDQMFDLSKNPAIDMDGVFGAYQRNLTALIEANKAAMTGYQELYARQAALVQESLAKAKDQVHALQGQPIDADTAAKNVEAAKAAFDKAMADVQELAEMAQKANTDAFAIVKDRFEEQLAEFKAATDKAQA